MRLRKIFNRGKIINADLYKRLQKLDAKVFPGCINEFKDNRDWWVIVDNNKIVAYCGCLYSVDNVCIFVRAWVYEPYRGRGIQKRMIKARMNAAKGYKIITYTSHDNVNSANNLIKLGFKLYLPEYRYAGKEMIYFIKQ